MLIYSHNMAKREWADIVNGDVITERAIMEAASEIRYGIQKRSPFGIRWIKVNQLTLAVIAKMELSALEMRVLLYLCSSAHDGNLVDVNQSVIAKELGSYQSNISVALKNLVERKVLTRIGGEINSKFTVYRVTSRFAWYGSDNETHDKDFRASPMLQ